jgi:hypothetical protein
MLSVIVRFHEGAAIALLRRALYSLLGNQEAAVEVIVMVQYGDASLLDAVGSLCASALVGRSWQVRGVRAAAGEDLRSALLSEGVQHASGRHVAFLDFDDVLFLNGVLRSVDICEQDDVDMVVGQTLLAGVRGTFPNDYVLTKERFVLTVPPSPLVLVMRNFAPICSVVIRRSFFARTGLTFSRELSRVEDYDMLIKVLGAGTVGLRPLQLGVINAQYNLNIDVGGTSLGLWRSGSKEEGEAEAALWARCRQMVAETSMTAHAPFSLSEIKEVFDFLATGEGGYQEFTTNLKAFSDRVHALAQA